MDDALLDVVLGRLEDQPLAENAAALLLAALRGDALRNAPRCGARAGATCTPLTGHASTRRSFSRTRAR
jgi:hypothetical protein